MKVFDVIYYFEQNQVLRVMIYDKDQNDEDDLIGTYEVNLNKLLTSPGQQIKENLVPAKWASSKSKIILNADKSEEDGVNDELTMQMVAHVQTLHRKGFLCFSRGNPDRPYLKIFREPVASDFMTEDEHWVSVYESKPE